MVQEMDEPLIKLTNMNGYPYPVPHKIYLASLNPEVCTIKMPRLDIVQWPQLQLDGKTTKIFQTVARWPAALVLPVTAQGEIVLAEVEHPHIGKFQSFVAGDLDPEKDKTLGQAAARELKEEIGYTADEFHVVFFHEFVPGWQWFAYTIIATNARKIAKAEDDIGERCQEYKVSFEELIRMARTEKFRYPPVLINKMIIRDEIPKLKRMFKNPAAFAAITYPNKK